MVNHHVMHRVACEELPEALAPGDGERLSSTYQTLLLRPTQIRDDSPLCAEQTKGIVALVGRDYDRTGVVIHRPEAALRIGLRAGELATANFREFLFHALR